MATAFIKFSKRTDCFAHFSKLSRLHTHSNLHVRLLSWARQLLICPDKGRGTQKLTTDLHKNTVPMPAASEGCTFLNAEAGKSTQNIVHIGVEALRKAQLNFQHFHQKSNEEKHWLLPLEEIIPVLPCQTPPSPPVTHKLHSPSPGLLI